MGRLLILMVSLWFFLFCLISCYSCFYINFDYLRFIFLNGATISSRKVQIVFYMYFSKKMSSYFY
jgi:hypothetical protein